MIADILLILALLAGFLFILLGFKVLFEFAYRHIAWFRREVDAFCVNSSDWD